MAWMDNTGLYRKFGTEKAVVNLVGEYCTYGSLREVVARIDFSRLGTVASTPVILGDVTLLPKMRMEEVEITVLTPPATITALNIGTIGEDRVSNSVPTALVAAAAIATLTPAGAKQTIRVGTAGAGTALGTTLALPALITASFTGTASAGGVGLLEVRIRYMAI